MIASGNSSAILSGTPVTAPTAEMSVLAAMGGFAPVPQVLAGILRDAPIETHNAARLARFVKTTEEISQEIPEAAPESPEDDVLTLGDGESLVADLTESGMLVETEDDIAEVLALVEDGGGTWARVRYAESGVVEDVHCDRWEDDFGTAGELEILTAWDHAEVTRLRSTLIAA